MSFQPASLLRVYYTRGEEPQLLGRLALKARQIFFEYHAKFLQTGLELSPFHLPLKPGVSVCKDHLFEGLWGVFNDSLPDGWGRLLLDRKLVQLRLNPGTLSPLDRLRYVGRQGMGALVYEPEMEEPFLPALSLDAIADEVLKFQDQDEVFAQHLTFLISDLLSMRITSWQKAHSLMCHLLTSFRLKKLQAFLVWSALIAEKVRLFICIRSAAFFTLIIER